MQMFFKGHLSAENFKKANKTCTFVFFIDRKMKNHAHLLILCDPHSELSDHL